MKNSPQSYFYFTSAERKSIAWISAFCIVLIFLPKSYKYLFQDKQKYDFSNLPDFSNNHPDKGAPNIAEVQLFEFNPNNATKEDFISLGLSPKLANTIINFRSKGAKFYKPDDFKKVWGLSAQDYQRLLPYMIFDSNNNTYANKDKIDNNQVVVGEPFAFNPNTATDKELASLGIPYKAVRHIINYRNKYTFRKKSDLQRIFDFSPELYTRLEPYIQLDNMNAEQHINKAGNIASNNNITQQYENTTIKPSKKTFAGTLDVNSATPEQWQQLPGIGAGYANKIVNFRNKLGGFYDINQVKETFGLPDSTFQKIKPYLVKNTAIPTTININTITQEELSKHPYIKFNHAKIIINYRNMHTKIEDANEFKKIYGIQDIVPKILPYLTY